MQKRLFIFIISVMFLIGIVAGSVAQESNIQGDDVSKQELESFSDAFNDVQSIQEDLNSEINELIEDSSFSRERFNQLYSAFTSGNEEQLSQLGATEQENFQALVNQINTIQEQRQEKMLVAVEDNGLTVQEFNNIVSAIQQDPELQERFQEIHQN